MRFAIFISALTIGYFIEQTSGVDVMTDSMFVVDMVLVVLFAWADIVEFLRGSK